MRSSASRSQPVRRITLTAMWAAPRSPRQAILARHGWTVAGGAQTLLDAGRSEQADALRGATQQAAAQYRGVVLGCVPMSLMPARAAVDAAVAAAIRAERSASHNIDVVRRQVEQGQAAYDPARRAAAYLLTSLARVQAEAARSLTRSPCFRRSAVAGGTGQIRRDAHRIVQ